VTNSSMTRRGRSTASCMGRWNKFRLYPRPETTQRAPDALGLPEVQPLTHPKRMHELPEVARRAPGLFVHWRFELRPDS
jgi:hypothetical protein